MAVRVNPQDADALIATLGLSPHPEGGWYKETWRGPSGPDGRSIGTAILFLLRQGERSHWHRVDADEFWFWHAGSSLTLEIARQDSGPVEAMTLGPDIMAGNKVQGHVPAHQWQAARADTGWALVSCTVTPGFDFAGFTLAPQGWSPGTL